MAATTTTTMAGTVFLSANVESLLHKLSSSDFIEYVKYSHLNLLKLTVLETKLLTIHSVMHDAEQKQFFNPEVKKWMNELYDAISVAEDLLDEIGYDSLRCKVENAEPRSGFHFNFNFEIQVTCRRLQRFVEHAIVLGLQSVTVSDKFSLSKIPTSLVANESVIVGRKDDKEKLMNMLLSDSGNDNKLGVIAILGVGGVGKTTLVRLVYDDKEVNEHFDLKAWVPVKEGFDIFRITKALAESVGSLIAHTGNDLNHVRVTLKEELMRRRFLFVFDDLWNESYNDWYDLITPLVNGNCGSRVIITTRHEKVAEVAHTYPIHKLEPLSDEHCWSLLSKHVFGTGGIKYPNLETIGRKIAKKCGGLPLAAKTLGGILSSKIDAKEWNAILNNNIWNIPNNNIMPALLLSYLYLPSHLKRCFIYCSIFPKGYLLEKKHLVLLWMAEGFLEHSAVEKAFEEVGDDFFIELLSRSLIEQFNDDTNHGRNTNRENFVMHDLVYDLATIVSGKSCSKFESGHRMSKDVYHFSYNQEEYDIFKKFETLCDFKSLRSFIPIGPWWQESCLSCKVFDYLLPRVRGLRVLSLSNYKNITVLPDSIDNLVHLRYLNLSYTGIKCLPDTTCDLYYLQSLILSGCNLVELPVHIGKLINLRHLDISYKSIIAMPMQIVRLENLQTLTVFVVGNQEVGLSVKELGKFPNLRGKLRIKNLHNVIDVSEACDANLKSKEHLEELEVHWDKQFKDAPTDKVVLDVLQPSMNLKKLSIDFYSGTSFPNWLGDCSFSNMVYICLSSCEHCVTLPPLGQLPSLKDLLIKDMSKVETIGPEFYGMIVGSTDSQFQPFPTLETLQFERMSNWKEWLSFGGNKFPFPRLKTLRLDQCHELKGNFPSHLSSIEEISVYCCDRLLAIPSTLHWLSSVKSLTFFSKGSTELSLLGSDSACLLQVAKICNFNTLPTMPKMFLRSTCLQHLELVYISSLAAFSADCLPTTLQSLLIIGCGDFTFLPTETWSKYTSLVTLELEDCCDALTSFPLNGFPVLQSLSIKGFTYLESIFILESASLGPSTLQSLKVSNCEALRSLPRRMDSLIALESLSLDNLSSCCEVSCLPPKLQVLHFESMRITTPLTEWGLPNLSALCDLHIDGDDIVSTLLKEQLLPVFLVSLTISNLSEMRSFKGNGLQHVSSMKIFTFNCCSRLESFAELRLPSFLKSLVIVNCPELKSLPDRLPSSLESLEFEECRKLRLSPLYKLPSSLKLLSIKLCPLLKAWYETKRREHVSMNAHFPVLKINHEVTI